MNKKQELINFLKEELGVSELNSSSVGKAYKHPDSGDINGLLIVINKQKVKYIIINSQGKGRIYLTGQLNKFNGHDLGFLKEAKDGVFKKEKDYMQIIQELLELS